MMKSAKQLIFTGINGIIMLLVVISSFDIFVCISYYFVFIVAEMFNSYFLWNNDIEKG